jgi:hypothetical protein
LIVSLSSIVRILLVVALAAMSPAHASAINWSLERTIVPVFGQHTMAIELNPDRTTMTPVQVEQERFGQAEVRTVTLMFRNLWALAKPVLLLAGAFYGWRYVRRHRASISRSFLAIVRWYYFTFHPHPAEPIVQGAIRTGTVLDGRALANALGEVPPGNSIFRKVRLEQADRLVTGMQTMSREKVRAMELRAANDFERAAFITTREAIALAAVALEQAKAAWQASEAMRMRGSTR